MNTDDKKIELNYYPITYTGSFDGEQANSPVVNLEDSNIVPGGVGSIVESSDIRSRNYVKGESGWSINSNGNAEFQDGVFRGNFEIGGTQITIDNTEDVQATIDAVSAAGGGTVYLQPGTYTLTTDLTIPSGVTLEGVSRDTVIIDCNSSYSVVITGTNAYSTGTVTINTGDTTVTGSGTTWTAGMVGRYIYLDGNWYEITARSSNTSITIGTAFGGENLSGASYVLADVNFTATLRRLTITGATGAGVECIYAMEPKFDDLIITGNGTGMDLDYVVFPYIFSTANENGVNLDFNYVAGFKVDFSDFSGSTTGAGVVMTNSGDATFFDSAVTSNTGDGINLTGCSNIAFISVDVWNNGGQGIELVSGNNDIQFIAVTSHSNTSDGYKLTATSDRITISNCSIHDNGGYGVNIAASTCDNNYIVAPAFDNNTSGNISNSGTNTVIIKETDAITEFGSGTDGAATISGDTTLTSDKYYTTLTVNSGVNLNTGGYAIYCSESATINGTLRNNGSNGSNGGTDGAAGGAGGAGAAGVTFTAGTAGGNGGDSGLWAGLVAGGVGTAGANKTCLGSNGSAGGRGGDDAGINPTNTPGAGGTATSETVESSFISGNVLTAGSVNTAARVVRFKCSTNGFLLSTAPGAGGGSGGDPQGGANGNGGGGGGGSGGVVFLAAPTITVGASGAIQSNGGNGGNGGGGAGYGGGGGAGGNGGNIFLLYKTLTNNGSIVANGGTKGTGGTATGGNGADGNNGASGKIYKLNVV